MKARWFAGVVMGLAGVMTAAQAAEMPRIVEKDGRHALLVDGAPYLVLGAQINNSSSWPEVLPKVWPALEAMHVNTAEAPVYWEQMEPKEGAFDFGNVDVLVEGGARAPHAPGAAVVRNVEERQHALRTGVGEDGHGPVPAHDQCERGAH